MLQPIHRFTALWSALLIPALWGCAEGASVQGPDDDPPPPPGHLTGDITLQPAVTFQTIIGWEAHNESGQHDVANFEAYSDDLFRLVVDEVGISRIRLEVRSGMENTVDIHALHAAGLMDQQTFRCRRWETVNDNASAGSTNPAGFHFSYIDETVEKVILPIRQRLAARGEPLYLNLTYVSFTRECNDNAAAHRDPAEYAEFILAAFRHLHGKYGLIPDALEVILEPDNVPGWQGKRIGEAIAAAGAMLETNGYRPDFIGPSTAGMHRAPTYFDQMVNVPGVTRYLKELSYHRYEGATPENLGLIVDRATQYGLRTAMLERLKADYHALHEDLELGQVSSWQQFAIAFLGDGSGGNVLIGVDFSGATPRPFLTERTKFLRQYFKFIRPGAVRIAAGTTKPAFAPLAFVNADGAYVVVVKADAGGTFTVADLPAGTYGLVYTTNSEYDVHLADAQVSTGQVLSAAIPAAGVITIFGK